MKTLETLRALAATDSRNEKEQIILEAFMGGERDFFIGAKLANDKLVSFGVAKVAEIKDADDGESGTLPFQDFLKLTRRLQRRELTGHAARDAIHEAASRSGIAIWNEFYRRILLKDLKIGCEASTINKVLTKIGKTDVEAISYLVPIFQPQLAKDIADDEGNILPKFRKGKWLVDIKFDGARLLTFLDKDAGTVTQYTREGRVNENFPHITTALAKVLPDLPYSVVFDGEVVAGSFQELMEQINSTDKADSGKTKLAIFDLIPMADFLKGNCEISQENRHTALVAIGTSDLFRQKIGECAYVLPKQEIDFDTPEGNAAYEELWADTQEKMKDNPILEGLMFKRPNAGYHCNGNDSWCRWDAWGKVKPRISVSLTCISVEVGKAGTKYAATVGALVFEGEDMDRKFRVSVGSGFTDEKRNEWYANPDLIIGMIGEVLADKPTIARGSDVWSLRFPTFKGWRGWEKGQKI
jgi:DNA ligase-1